jgi:hypothetical protein
MGPLICIVPDNDWESPAFKGDLEIAVARLQAHLGIPVEIRKTEGYYPTQKSWSEEFGNDLRETQAIIWKKPGRSIIGVTDDALAQVPSVKAHADRAWPDERLAVVSMFGGGKPGTLEHQERLFRLLLRGAAFAQYSLAPSSDANSLLYSGIDSPRALDGKALPALP